MTLHTPYSPGDPIKSSFTNDDINGLSDGTNDVDNNSLTKFRLESFDPYFATTGATWTLNSGLNMSMSSGVLYIGGNRIPISAIGSKTYTTSKDTYVDFSNSGVVAYTERTIGDTAPALVAGYTRNAIITTNGSTVTNILQQDRDNLGNPVCNRKPVAKESSAPRVNLITTTATVNGDTTNHDIIAITALASGLTIGLPVGTPANGQAMLYRIKDNGSARAITWNGVFRAIGVTLPTATVASKTLYVSTRYNTQDNRWDILAVGREA